jgi:hypothetical protein
MEGLFDLAAEVFKKVPLKNTERVVCCEGPGRLLSLRIAAVACNQWAASKAKGSMFSYNSLELASTVASRPIRLELRSGTFTAWKKGRIEVSSELSDGIGLLKQEEYAKAVQRIPFLFEKIAKPISFFDPPLWAPIQYAKV